MGTKLAMAAAGIAVMGIAATGVAGPSRAEAASYVAHLDLSYDLDSPPPIAAQNRLDVYEPQGFKGRRPVAVYVHGGGWKGGDKGNRIADKARLFTENGYVFVSINYRLSPDPPDTSDPNRVMFPDHPHDVGEAIGWLSRNVGAYGGDRRRIILLGHSAGAHLVSLVATDPRYIKAYDVKRKRILGAVPLDTAAFDIAARADPDASTLRPQGLVLEWNAFGTPAENALTGSWTAASPIVHAGRKDPPFLLVTQLANPIRQHENRRMAAALGQDPGEDVLLVDLDHEGINRALGAPGDASGETEAVMAFAGGVTRRPRARIKQRPRERVRSKGGRTRVRFSLGSNLSGSSFECKLDRRGLRRCRSPKSYRVGGGKHRFRVRALNGKLAGPWKSDRFRVVQRGSRR